MSTTDQLGFSFKPFDRRVWTVAGLVSTVRTHIERDIAKRQETFARGTDEVLHEWE